MEHTPGPWTLHDTHDGGLALVEAECLRITVDHREDFGRAKPDAILIAAAPELLAACKAVLARGCSCQSTEDENWHAPAVLAAACPIPMVKAAIAKAEGRDGDAK